MKPGFYFSTIGKILNWAKANSLSYVSVGTCCCSTEIEQVQGCRYDLERFGCLPEVDPRHADLLIVSGMITYKAAPYLRQIYESMRSPKYVIAIGACSSCGGKFAPEFSYSTVPGVDRIIPVDVYVPGCPPRPEAIMNGLITLQEKICGHQRIKNET